MTDDERVNRFLTYVNNRIEDLDMTKSSLGKCIGIDKNSMNLYLKGKRNMPTHVALKIANYLGIDVSKVCGIPCEQTLTAVEMDLIRELRSIPESNRMQLEMNYINIARMFKNGKSR